MAAANSTGSAPAKPCASLVKGHGAWLSTAALFRSPCDSMGMLSRWVSPAIPEQTVTVMLLPDDITI